MSGLTDGERESLLASWREGPGRRDAPSDERLAQVDEWFDAHPVKRKRTVAEIEAIGDRLADWWESDEPDDSTRLRAMAEGSKRAPLPRLPLIDFLLARIADDEGTIPFLTCECGEGVSEVDPLPTCPDRIAADIEGRRLLVEGVRAMRESNPGLWIRPDWFTSDSKWHGDAPYVLRCLALPYAGHPDYQEGWKP